MSETNKKRYREFMHHARLLFGGRCISCGSTEKLEFDHIDPSTKLFKIAEGWRLSRQLVLAELAKCQLLCFKCHRSKSYKSGDHRRYNAVKLTPQDVRRIRLNDEGWSSKQWGKELGIHATTVMQVVKNQAWTDIEVIGPRRLPRIQTPVKLTPELVREIRAETGKSGRELAKKYGVGTASISRIRRGQSWKAAL